jgi:hypothetical protein
MKRLRIYLPIGLAAVLICGLGMMRLRAQDEELDPVKIAPEMNRLIFENAFVRVTEERTPAGRSVPRHRHQRSVIVALSDYDMEQKIYPSGQVTLSHRHVGEVNWTEPLIHETHNVGTANQSVVRIELK